LSLAADRDRHFRADKPLSAYAEAAQQRRNCHMIAAPFVTHPTSPSKRIAALPASDRGAETPAGKTAKSTNGKFAAGPSIDWGIMVRAI
jgi:hypothetical protein